VAVVTKEGLSDGCTVYAQGGICAVLDPLDSVEQHSHDTLVAGDFLNDKQYAAHWSIPLMARPGIFQ
jgi:L-aspartate oxidase